MTSVVVVTSDPAITVAQDTPAITAIVPVTQFPQTKSGVSISTPLAASTDFNTVTAAGFYYTIDALSVNAPVAAHLWYLNVDVDGGDPTFVRQIATMLDAGGATFIRTLIGGSWGSWQAIVALDGAGRLPAVDGSQLTNVNAGVSSKILNAIGGLTFSTAGATSLFSVAAGAANDSTNVTTMVLASAISKTTNSWSPGNGNGSLDTGVIANITWYHAFLIENVATAAVDVLISLSATAPSLPTGYTLFRRIFSLKTDGSGHWVQVTQSGDEFLWNVQVQDAAAVTVANVAGQLFTLSVPTGIQVWSNSSFYFTTATSSTGFFISSPDVADNAPTASLFDAAIAAGFAQVFTAPVRTNTSAQVRIRASITYTSGLTINTRGWFDRRGRL